MHTNKIENRYKIYMGMAKENPIKLFILVHLKLRFWKKQSGAFFFRHPVCKYKCQEWSAIIQGMVTH